MTTKNAGLAKKLGYKNVRAYLGGEPDWIKAEYLTYASKGFIEKGNIILIDLRKNSVAVKGRIKRAISIPYDKLEDRMDEIPKKAPIVVYGSEEQVTDAVDDFRSSGFKMVSAVKGGYAAWAKAGGATESGAIIPTDIKWVRKLGKGEVSVADFKKATDGMDPNIYVIDARTKDEVAELGIFKNTVNIPLDEITKRMHTFPKNKKIYVHCSTGARADMAYQELVKNGFDVKFLLLNISDAECDCEILKP